MKKIILFPILLLAIFLVPHAQPPAKEGWITVRDSMVLASLHCDRKGKTWLEQGWIKCEFQIYKPTAQERVASSAYYQQFGSKSRYRLINTYQYYEGDKKTLCRDATVAEPLNAVLQ